MSFGRWVANRGVGGMSWRVRHKQRLREIEQAVHRKKRLRRWRLSQLGMSVVGSPVTIITGNQTGVNAVGDRAWPEVSGEPPVFGNRIGEIGHTAGGSWIWTGFTWERAILGG